MIVSPDAKEATLTALRSTDGRTFRYTRESVERIRRTLGLDLEGVTTQQQLGERFLDWIALATERCPGMTIALESLLRFDGPDGRPAISAELEDDLRVLLAAVTEPPGSGEDSPRP